MNWSEVIYVPQAKWKFGERSAIGRLNGWKSSSVCPVFRLPPPGDYDPEIDAKITPQLYLKSFGAQLADARGRRLTIVNGVEIQELRNSDTGGLLFTELLERARLAGAVPLPQLRLNAPSEFRNAAVHFARRSCGASACISLDLADLEFLNGREELLASVNELGLISQKSLLLVDGGALDVDDVETFSSVLMSHFNRLFRPGDWGAVVWSAGSFPERDGVKAGESKAFERKEWRLFRQLLELREEFAVFPVFSDYLLEYPLAKPPKGMATPTAKLLYSTENKFFVFKGKSVRNDDKYANIFPVARSLIASGVYKGPQFSVGDAQIEKLSGSNGTTGHAGTWRGIAVDHHLELVTSQLDGALGLGRAKDRVVVEPDQLRLV